jgi:formyl-CoA transferase
VVQAASGITMLNGTADTVPNRIGPPMFDYLAGIYGAFAVLSALRERDRTGQSQMVDVAMLDAAIVAMASTVSTWSNAGVEPRPNGNTAASGSPASGIFATRDGLLSIAANQDQQVIRLCTAAGIGEVLQDARFASVEARAAHAGEFQQLLVEVFATRDASAWEQLLSDVHVPATRVRSVPQILAEPHMQQRQVQQTVVDPQTGASIAVPSIGFKWNQQALGPQQPPPRLGQHTEAVLAGLGIDMQTVSQLRASRVID